MFTNYLLFQCVTHREYKCYYYLDSTLKESLLARGDVEDREVKEFRVQRLHKLVVKEIRKDVCVAIDIRKD